jgi:hypothetical protein
MPSIQGRKAHQETQQNAKFLRGILVVVSQAVKHILLAGFVALFSIRHDLILRSSVTFLGGNQISSEIKDRS